MKLSSSPRVVPILLLAGALPSAAQSDDIFDFFAQEAQVMSASLQPTALTDAPATVYVVTAEDIAASGSRTLWDALRGVPGVDVMTTRAWHGEVGIRGLNRPLNNRVLVLLNGKTVLNGFFDFVTWEAIPVTLAEVDRIEVVLGPASALYGANAVNGVINIITEPSTAAGRPATARQGEVSLSAGERSTRMGHVLYGRTIDDTRMHGSVAWRSGDQFEADRSSSRVVKSHAVLMHPLGDGRRLRLSGGLAAHDTELATSGGAGAAFNDGGNGFVDAQLEWQDTRVRGFWNRGRSRLRGFDRLREPNTDYDTFDLSVTHSLSLSGDNHLVAGGSYRHNRMRSKVFGPGPVDQDLWAGYLEDVWTPRPDVNVTLSGRADWHPRSGWSFSPRASLTLHVAQRHVVRASTGTAFRNPTLTENHIDFTDRFSPNEALGGDLPVEIVELHFLGNLDLESEQLLFVEGSYTGLFGPLRASVAGFHYRLNDIITAGDIQQIEIELPLVRLTNSFTNAGDLEAWGGEAGARVRLTPRLQGYTNYSLLDFTNAGEEEFASTDGGPRHKVNAGVRWQPGAWLADVSAHWVEGTHWDSSPLPNSPVLRVDDFYLVNAHLSHTLGDAWHGLQVGIDAFNLTNHRHAQLLPAQAGGGDGQAGEGLERRLLLSITYPL